MEPGLSLARSVRLTQIQHFLHGTARYFQTGATAPDKHRRPAEIYYVELGRSIECGGLSY